MNIAPYRKAVVGGITAGVTTLAAVMQDTDGVTRLEWFGVAVAVVLGAVGVYQIPNKPKGSVMDNGHGQIELILLIAVVFLVLLIFLKVFAFV